MYTGANIGYELSTYQGLYNYVKAELVPIDWFVNTDYEVIGDRATFNFYIAPQISRSNDPYTPNPDETADGCELADVVCTGTNSFTITMGRKFNEIYPFEKCRISVMEAAVSKNPMITYTPHLEKFVTDIEYNYAKAELFMIVNDLVSRWDSIKSFTLSGESVNVLEELEEVVLALEELHEVDRGNQTLLVDYKTSSDIRAYKGYNCCIVQTAFEPEEVNQIGVERMIRVPKSYLKDEATGIEYRFVNYLRAFYFYAVRCEIAETFMMANEWRDYVGYQRKGIWETFLDEFVNVVPEAQGVAGYKVANPATLPAESTISSSGVTATDATVTYSYTANSSDISESSLMLVKWADGEFGETIETVQPLVEGDNQTKSFSGLDASTDYVVYIKQGVDTISEVAFTTAASAEIKSKAKK